jgi:hypothetical protein
MLFSFKIFILPLILPSLGLCCPERPQHSPQSTYIPAWRVRERVKRKETRKSVRKKQTDNAGKATIKNSENK